VRGASGLAGELGHVTAVPGGRLCACGRRGCIETYVSGSGLPRTYDELRAERGLAPREETPQTLHAAALAGDDLARATFERSGQLFASPLVDLTLLFAPAQITFTGGLTHAGDTLLEPLRRHYEAALPDSIEPATLRFDSSSDATLAGAAALALADPPEELSVT
jgi:glucokinase